MDFHHQVIAEPPGVHGTQEGPSDFQAGISQDAVYATFGAHCIFTTTHILTHFARSIGCFAVEAAAHRAGVDGIAVIAAVLVGLSEQLFRVGHCLVSLLLRAPSTIERLAKAEYQSLAIETA
ncbi:MAG: hypothetical protein WC028_28840 [Candidatus Obscuribacterales bacterium]